MCMISSVSIMLNASIPLFHQHLVFIVYESLLGLKFVSLSTKIEFVNLKKALYCFFISSVLLIGHTSVFRMVVVKSFRSFFKSSHCNSKRSVVWSWRPHGHDGVSLILKRCKYEFMLPCPVTIRVKLWVRFSFMFNLAAISGKYCLAICPLDDWSHSLCHFAVNIYITH